MRKTACVVLTLPLLLTFAIADLKEAESVIPDTASVPKRRLKGGKSKHNIFISKSGKKPKQTKKSCKSLKSYKGAKGRDLKSSKSDCSSSPTKSPTIAKLVTGSPTPSPAVSTLLPSPLPTALNCSSQEARESVINEIIIPLIDVNAVDDATSLALNWLRDVDVSNACEDDGTTMKERFTLALIYYRMGGDGWFVSSGWLSKDDHCESWSLVGCDDAGRVTTISMNINNVIGEIPPEIFNLSELSTLKLYHNNIQGEIPSSIYQLKNLSFLDVENNNLKGKRVQLYL